MGTPLKKPPVYFTVAQVRFNTLLKLGDFLPLIQERFRKAGYPAYSIHSSFAVQISIQNGQAVPHPVPRDHHLFANAEKTHSFVLGTDALTFQSTNYGTYEQFSLAFLKGLELVHNEVDLAFTERVGLRYLDHVFPKLGDSLEFYLAPGVQGLGAHLGGAPIHSYAEALNQVGHVKLKARIVIQDGGVGFPPDVLPQGMVLQLRFAQDQGLHAILDTDGFVEGREPFSISAISQHLLSIHDVISKALKVTVTDYALAVWNAP